MWLIIAMYKITDFKSCNIEWFNFLQKIFKYKIKLRKKAAISFSMSQGKR